MANVVLNVAQYLALGPGGLPASDNVTLADTGANLAALTPVQIGVLSSKGVDRIDATNNALSLSVAQAVALGAVTLTAADVVTVTGTGAQFAALSTAQLAALATRGVDRLDATDNVLMLNKAKALALGAMTLAAADAVVLADTGAQLRTLTPAQIAGLAAKGFDRIDVTNNALSLSVAQAMALGAMTLTAADVVTVTGTGAQFAALSTAQFVALATKGVDRLDATDNVLTLNKAKALALGAMTLAAADAVVLADTGAQLSTLTPAQITGFAAKGFDRIDATNNALSLSVAQAVALGSVTLTAADVVTVTGTGAQFAALSTAQLAALATKGVDRLDATDNVLTLNKAKALALGAMTLVAADAVVLADTGAQLSTLTPAQIAGLAAKGFDRIDVTNNALSLSVAQAMALGAMTLTAADVVTVTGTGAQFAALSTAQLAALATKGVDRLDATDNVLTLNKAKALTLGAMTLTAGDVVVLADTGAQLSTLTPAQIAGLAAKGFDRFDATNNSLILTAAQYDALGGVVLTAGDVVTLRDTGANIAALSASALQGLAAKGIDRIDATDNGLALTAAQLAGVSIGSLTRADVVTFADTGAKIGRLAVSDIAALAGKDVDKIYATDDVLSLTVAKYLALGAVTLTAADTVTLADSGANLQALSVAQIAALAGKGIDRIDSTNALSLTLAKVQALGTVLLTGADTVVLSDTAAVLGAASAADFAALAGKGVDRIDLTNNALSITVAKLQALGVVLLTAADTVTLSDTGAALGALTPAEIAALAGKGVDAINATGDALTLSVAQYRALGTVSLTGADHVILADSSANLATLTPAENAALAGKGIDEVQTTGATTIETALASYTLDALASNLTFIGVGPFSGTGNGLANTITGGQFGDTLIGLGGNDTLLGLSGDDTLIGGLGADVLDGGAGGGDWASYRNSTGSVTASLATPTGNTGEAQGDTYIGIERLEGSAFDDTLTGDAGNNSLRGLGGADALNGGAGRDTASYFTAGAGLTVSLAAPGNNTGEAAGDTYTSIEDLSGSAFNDVLTGDANINFLLGNGGEDALDGGGGFDYASYVNSTIGVKVSLANPGENTGEAAGDTYKSIEGLMGSSFADTLIGDAGGNWLMGGLGADILNGGAGFDFTYYGNAAAAVTVSLINPFLNTGDATGDTFISVESIAGSNFNDFLTGDAVDNWLRGGLGADALNGGAGFDFADYDSSVTGITASLMNSSINTGEATGDTYVLIEGLNGTAVADFLYGDNSDNWLIGQAGGDYLDGGAGNDFAAYSNAAGGLRASLASSASNTGEAAGDTYVSIESLGGTAFDDVLIGNGGNNTLRGRLGADVLNGGGGFDVAEYFNATSGITASLDTSLPVVNTGEAAGDTFVSIEGLAGSTFADILVGNAGDNQLKGYGGADILFGGAGNDTYYGNSVTSGFDGATDRVDYSRVTGLTQGISVNWNAGSVVGQAGIIDTDSMFQIEAVFGTAFVDTFDATGYSAASARAGDFGSYQFIQGGGGNDIVIGNNNTEVFYGDATSGVTVNLSIVGNVYGGTATGGAVGTDQLTNVNRFVGSNFNDTFFGTNNVEIFDGYNGGDDAYHGGGGNDIVEFDGSSRDAIDVNMAAGTIAGRTPGSNIGNDTMDSIERIRGSEFADRYDATGFSNLSTNAGSSGTFNRFEGQGGADEVIGNGNTFLDYFNASSSITVTMTGQGVGSALATYGSNTATDTFTNVAVINGSSSTDTFNGAIGNDTFYGQAGNDTLNGNGGSDILNGGSGSDLLNGSDGLDTADYSIFGSTIGVTASLQDASINTGDAAGDSYVSIENLSGSANADNLTGNSSSNVINGRGGVDTLAGNGGGDAFVFDSAIGAGHLATIVGYTHGQDHFNLENFIFTSLGSEGSLSAAAFRLGSAAADADDRIMYDPVSRNVVYDADGSGASVATVIAILQNPQGGNLDHTDFLIV